MWTIVLLTASSFVLYVVVLYPLLLVGLARRKRRAVRKEWSPRRISVLIPVRDGEAWIERKLRSVADSDYPPDLLEIVVVSDGSTDGTDRIAAGFAGIRLIRIPWSGKAAALNAGMLAASGEILVFTDARQLIDRLALRRLIECFADPEVGVVSGEPSILLGNSHAEADIGLYYRYETRLRTSQGEIDSVPFATGCLYAIRHELAAPLPSDTILDDVELPIRAFLKGYRCILEPTARVYDYPTALPAEFRRKMRTMAGLYQLVWRHPRLLTPANRMWLHFLSHKLGRLMLPFALMAIAAATVSEIHGWGLWLAGPQVLCYGLALADLAVPQEWKVKRLTSPLRSFVVLMAAALCAVSIVFVPARKFWTHTTRVRAPHGDCRLAPASSDDAHSTSTAQRSAPPPSSPQPPISS